MEGFRWDPPTYFGTRLGTLTHRRGGQGLAAHKLRWSHAAQEVTELGVRCQTNSPVVKAARRKEETKTNVPELTEGCDDSGGQLQNVPHATPILSTSITQPPADPCPVSVCPSIFMALYPHLQLLPPLTSSYH